MTGAQALLPWSRHLRLEEISWLGGGASGAGYRILHADFEHGLFVRNVRVAAGARSNLHRHIHPVLAFTTSGAWGHKPDQIEYTPDSYVYEPVGAVHRFHNGPGLTEATFVQLGDVEWLSEDGREVLRRETPRDVVAAYFEGCEAAGLVRPNIVS